MKKGKINALFKIVLAAFMVFSCLPSNGIANVVMANEIFDKFVLCRSFNDDGNRIQLSA